MKLSLAVKFNVVFLIVFIIGFIASSLFANYLLQKRERDESLGKARMLMNAAAATNVNTSDHIVQLLENRLKFAFLPQSTPSFAATEQLQQLLKSYPDIVYKEAPLNLTNPRDRATHWEAAVVNQLRSKPDTRELIGERADDSGPSLFVAQPILITNPACLACHTSPQTAPQTVVDRYGPLNGFGGKFYEIIGARLVSVPLAVPLQRSAEMLHTFMLSMLGFFVFLFCALNIMVYLFVTRRLKQMSALAERVSLGEIDVPGMDVSGKDELARMGQSFERMRTSLVSAMKMLET